MAMNIYKAASIEDITGSHAWLQNKESFSHYKEREEILVLTESQPGKSHRPGCSHTHLARNRNLSTDRAELTCAEDLVALKHN